MGLWVQREGLLASDTRSKAFETFTAPFNADPFVNSCSYRLTPRSTHICVHGDSSGWRRGCCSSCSVLRAGGFMELPRLGLPSGKTGTGE